MLEKSIYLNLVGGLDQIDLTKLLYAMHEFTTSILRCLIFQDRIFNIQSLKFLSYSVLLLASSYSAWIQNFLTLKAQGYLKLGDGERALRACKAPSGHCGSLGMSWGCQFV